MRSYRFLRARSPGVTILEVLVVIILLVTAFFPLISMFQSGLLVNLESKDSNVALKLAQMKMEQKLDLSFNAITNESVASFPGFTNYSAEVIVKTPLTNFKDIIVKVYFPVGRNVSKVVSVETYVVNL